MDGFRYTAGLWLLIFLPGCAGRVTTASGEDLWITSTAFQQYAEQVFRRQNHVGQELLEALEEAGESDDDWSRRLSMAEDRLWTACLALNEMAIAHQEGRRMDLLRRHEAALSVTECAAAAGEAEHLLGSRWGGLSGVAGKR